MKEIIFLNALLVTNSSRKRRFHVGSMLEVICYYRKIPRQLCRGLTLQRRERQLGTLVHRLGSRRNITRIMVLNHAQRIARVTFWYLRSPEAPTLFLRYCEHLFKEVQSEFGRKNYPNLLETVPFLELAYLDNSLDMPSRLGIMPTEGAASAARSSKVMKPRLFRD